MSGIGDIFEKVKDTVEEKLHVDVDPYLDQAKGMLHLGGNEQAAAAATAEATEETATEEEQPAEEEAPVEEEALTEEEPSDEESAEESQ